MKYPIPFLLLCLRLSAQTPCLAPKAFAELNANNIIARINGGGHLFTTGSSARFVYKPLPNKPSTIYSAGVWMGGKDESGNLRLAVVEYRSSSRFDFTAGPINPQTGTADSLSCARWDKVFEVKKQRIDSFLMLLPQWNADPQAAVLAFPEIMGWPGQFNPHYQDVWGYDLPQQSFLAPFADVDSDGAYNPLKGDYPAVVLQGKAPFVPAQIAWCVYNDVGSIHSESGGQQIGMEVQQTAWAFDYGAAPIANTIFTSHKFIYRGQGMIKDYWTGIWTDFDLGCYLDDYIGCNPAENYYFSHNQDPTDGQPGNQCQGTPTFDTMTPVQRVTLLNRAFDKFIYYNNAGNGTSAPGQLDPSTSAEFYHYLQGNWRDGTPLTFGGGGYDLASTDSVDFAFPDNPSDVNGWSMCTANLPFGDRRVLANLSTPMLNPGAIQELTIAWTLHPNVPGPCNLGDTEAEIDFIKQAYEDGFTQLNSGVNTLHALEAKVRLFPNPATGMLNLSYEDVEVQNIQVFDAQGKMFLNLNQPNPGQERLSLIQCPAGTYFLRLQTTAGVILRRLVVL